MGKGSPPDSKSYGPAGRERGDATRRRAPISGGGRFALGLIVLAAGAAAASSTSPAGTDPAAATSRRPVAQPAVVRVTAQDVRQMVRGAAGRVVLVNVWATWCEPCRKEFPDLLKLRRALAARGFDLVLVSADFENQLPQVRSFLAHQGVDFTTYLKSEGDMPFIDGMDPAWSGSLPATFVYDRSGTLRDFWEGAATYDKLLERASKLLGP